MLFQYIANSIDYAEMSNNIHYAKHSLYYIHYLKPNLFFYNLWGKQTSEQIKKFCGYR